MQLPGRTCERYHVVFYTFLCPTSYIIEITAGTGAAILDHEVTLGVEILHSRVTDRRNLGPTDCVACSSLAVQDSLQPDINMGKK